MSVFIDSSDASSRHHKPMIEQQNPVWVKNSDRNRRGMDIIMREEYMIKNDGYKRV